MKNKEAWDKFKNSGKVEDYLEYCKLKGEKSDNQTRRNNNK